MRSLLAACLVLASSAAFAADQTGGPQDAPVETEEGAAKVLLHVDQQFESAVPTLTPDEKKYIQQENDFANQLAAKTGGNYTSACVNAFYESKPFYKWVVRQASAPSPSCLRSARRYV
jgi:hypothetical protein